MGKRKIYVKTDLSTPQVESLLEQNEDLVMLPEILPTANTRVQFGRNATSARSYDFAGWYGLGIDSIVYACQKQIERFLAGQDREVEASSVKAYCQCLGNFFGFLVLRATAIERELVLDDINRDLIDGYLDHNTGQGWITTTQRSYFMNIKAVLVALGQRNWIKLISVGDEATFPKNPFPNSGHKSKGESPLSRKERQAFAAAVKHAVMPIWKDDVPLTTELLGYAMLIVALHTGRNTTPLLEMNRDCLREHPKNGNAFLVLWKRRGRNTNKVILRTDSSHEPLLESTPTIKTNVERLIRHIILRTESLIDDAPVELKNRVWIFRTRCNWGRHKEGQVSQLSDHTLAHAIRLLVKNYNLNDNDGKPLRLNISRLRKTFGNRVFELLDGDLIATSAALGNTPSIAGRFYLSPNEESKRNWRFMGEILVEELLSHTIGATYKATPTGHCSDPVNGQYAPKKKNAACINFLNCIRCQHYAITADDLYKLFSFYFRVLSERNRMDKQRWNKQYAHIPRLIDKYIIAEGLKRGAFKAEAVDNARNQARTQPHPFWSCDLIPSLEIFA
ncbi:hypothetical protein [Pseudomonas laurylsulfatiphila]|uniref:hypothetical protein n=1 Tax=Pseudomonas laurylsulfatiphila TaxID=2011015 RepID=UPI00216062FB|nr:hypothetical protein [Pseudomonas laurylsulfatiphila]UVM05747.1 hypothetical protein LOY25_03315 [Pseudomonas laurylsulfatiphila]